MLRRLLIVASLTTAATASLSSTDHVAAAGLDGATATRLAVMVNDVVYDPTRDVLYASVADTDPAYANQIITVDPDTNQIVASRSIGTKPAALAIDANGTALYVGVDGRGNVEKYSLPDWTKQWAYPFGTYVGYQIVAGDIEAMPGNPDTIAVSEKVPGLSPSHAGVVVIDGGVARTDITHGHTGSNSIVFGANAATLYGSDTEISSHTFYVHGIGSSGITEQQAIDGLGGGTLAYRSGFVYESNGKVIDVTGATPSLADTLPSGTAVAVDPDGSSVYYVTETHAGTGTATLRAYRTTDRQPSATWTIPNERNFVVALVSAGQGRFAYISSNHPRNRTGTLVLIQPGPSATGAFGEYTALTPTRILDTRSGLGTNGAVAPLQAGQAINVSVLGVAGVPVAGVQAVVLNATAVSPTEAGYITIYPHGTARPTISSLNFVPGQVVANLVTMPVGAGGMVTAYSPFGAVDLVFDIAGFYATETGPSGLRYQAVAPTRLVDTRSGQGGQFGALGADTSVTFQVSGQAGVPSSGVSAVALNVTVTQTTAPSFLTVHPTDVSLPVVSNLNFVAGNTRANQAIVRLPSNGLINVYNSAGSTQLVIDVVGYYDNKADGEHGRFVALDPFRAIDTRSDSPFAGTGALPNNSGLYTDPPDEMTAYVVNVTVTATTGSGFVTAFPYRDTNSAVPLASTLNYGPDETVPNHAIVPTGPHLGFYNTGATAHLIVDVFGAFT